MGTNYPDALSAGPAAEAEGAPIVLTTTQELPAVALALLEAMPHLHRIVVLGGTVAVSDDVATNLEALLGRRQPSRLPERCHWWGPGMFHRAGEK